MRNLLLLCCAFPVVLLASRGDSQFYYHAQSGKVDLVLASDQITVRVDEEHFTDWASILSSDPAIDLGQDPQPLWGGFFLIHLLGDNDPTVVLESLCAREDVAFAYPVFLNPKSKNVYVTNHVVVHFNDAASNAQIDSVHLAHNMVLTRTLFRDSRYQVLELPAHHPFSSLEIANSIFEAGLADLALPSFILPIELAYDPSDTYWEEQWYFKNTGQFGGPADVDIDLDEALHYTLPGNDTIVVGIIDNGVDTSGHPDLSKERIAWGWDYASGSPYWTGDPDYSATGLSPHGLAVAGIVAATTDNDTGLVGVASPSERVKVAVLKIFPDYGFVDAPQWVLASAFDDAADSGLSVVSCSWSTIWTYGLLYNAISYADECGTLVMFSAGNGNEPIPYPADHPAVVAVGATDSLDLRWYYSSYGSELDVVAPSAGTAQPWGNFFILDSPGIKSGYTWGPTGQGCPDPNGDYNCRFGGTSAACPEVAGVAALILLRRPDLRSTWLNNHTEQVREIIRYSAEREQYGVYDTSRVSDSLGWGRVNAARALLAVARGDADNNGYINTADATYIISYVMGGGPIPQPTMGTGDADCNGTVNIADAVYLIGYIFGGGPAPKICYEYDY